MFGEWLRKQREAERLSITKLSQYSGVSRLTITNWETGTDPGVAGADKLLRSMGWSYVIGAKDSSNMTNIPLTTLTKLGEELSKTIGSLIELEDLVHEEVSDV